MDLNVYIFADTPSRRCFIMMAIESLRVLRVHCLILLLSQANSYGRLNTPCFNWVLPDEKDSLGLLDNSGNSREFVGRK